MATARNQHGIGKDDSIEQRASTMRIMRRALATTTALATASDVFGLASSRCDDRADVAVNTQPEHGAEHSVGTALPRRQHPQCLRARLVDASPDSASGMHSDELSEQRTGRRACIRSRARVISVTDPSPCALSLRSPSSGIIVCCLPNTHRTNAMRWRMSAMALLMAALLPAAILAERFTPSLAPTNLPAVNGLPTTAMLLTRTSMPPGLTATSSEYVAPTPEQLADDHAAWVWVAPMIGSASSVPLTFLVTRVAEIVAANLVGFLGTPFFALRHFNGSVAVYEAEQAQGSASGDVYAPPFWLSGVYTEMTAGESHMCFLTVEQHAECRTTTTGFLATSALMESRSTVSYTQLSAASRFTCGLRAVDQLVECFGLAGADDNSPIHMNYTSQFRYASIAAQYDKGFCGPLVDTGEVACFNVHNLGNGPETVVFPAPSPSTIKFAYSLWMWQDAPFLQSCAMRSDGMLQCFNLLPVGYNLPRPMSQACAMRTVVMGATADNGQLQRADENYGWISDPAVTVFEVLRFIGVDPAQGDDLTCAAINTQSPTEMASFVPCASLAHALTLIAHPNTWIQLLPGSYTRVLNEPALLYGSTTLASIPPASFTPDELALLGNGAWAARMAEMDGEAVTVNCTGVLNCFTTLQHTHFTGLTFTGSLMHAIVSTSDNSTNDNSRLPPSSLTLTNCVFDAMGAVLHKQQGTVTITDCTISNSLEWANTTLGLIELEDATLVMSGTTFSNNHMPVAKTYLRSCLRSVSTLPVTIAVADSHWLDNSATSLAKPNRGTAGAFELVRIPGGVAMQVQVSGPLVLSIADSTFVRQTARCNACNGGAVSVITGVGVPLGGVSVSVSGATFDSNTNVVAAVDPNSLTALNLGSNYGGCLAISELDLSSYGYPTLLSAAAVTISNSIFKSSVARFGGCVFLGILYSLDLSFSQFDQCAGFWGGSLYIWSPSYHGPLGFAQLPYYLTGLVMGNGFVRGSDLINENSRGGAILLVDIRVVVSFEELAISNTSSMDRGGAISISSCSPEVLFSLAHFSGLVATTHGGAISVESTPFLTLMDCAFNNVVATSRGGFEHSYTRNSGHAIAAAGGHCSCHVIARLALCLCACAGAVSSSSSIVTLSSCTFEDVFLRAAQGEPDASKVIDRLGGVIAATSGGVRLSSCTITRVSALPNDLAMSSCAKSFDASAALSTVGLGGVVFAESSDVYLWDNLISEARSCSGGVVYARGSPISISYGEYSNVHAHSGGIAALVACVPVDLTDIGRTEAVAAVAAGGALVLNECPTVQLQGNVISDVTVTNGDGGLMWMYALRRPALLFKDNTLTLISAPRGAGAIMFVQSAPNAFAPLDPINNSSLRNRFINQSLHGLPSLYGPLTATGVTSLAALHPTLTVSAGSLLSTPLSPLRIIALDAYQQTITQDRGLIVQVTGPDAIEFRGTTLRKIQATDGSALFSDLSVIAAPGTYTLGFAIVGALNVSVELSLLVTTDCPAASFYSSSDRSCTPCGSDVLVYNATANACQRCPAGWQRVASNDTSGALRDGVSCAICPLGQVSAAGGLCAPCGPNTYQPTPLGECVQCSSVDGLSCVGDGLAQVQSGFFALAVGSGREQRIQTYQCPETFCSAAQVQVAAAAGNSSSAVNSFRQCAFPRLASPTNLLCGECAEGYRPWGNKCAQCDSVDGGLMLLLVVLSLLLCFWLIRSSLGPPSAGHSTVVLYFVQTAMLELGSLNGLLAWLNVVLLSPNSVGRCVAPLTPYEQVQAAILMPVALWIELMVIALIHCLAFKRWGSLFAHEPTVDANTPFGTRVRTSALHFISQFSIDMYISATFSLLLFTYTQVAVACVSYLRCVDVGDESVVFSQPSMRCGSDEYAKTKVLVVLALILYVAGFPVGIAAFLWRRSDMVRESHSSITQLVHGVRAWSPSVAARAGEGSEPVRASFAPAVPSSSEGTDSASSPVEHFLRRYAPLFAMYSSAAWFWQVFVLARRTVFVVISVMLLATPRRRFMAFALATLVSSLLQQIFAPFRLSAFNRIELGSQSLLLILSITLTSESSPYSSGVNAFIFMLVVPPLVLYILNTVHGAMRQAKQDREKLLADTLRAQLEKENRLAVASPVEVELQENPAAAVAASSSQDHPYSPSAAASDSLEAHQQAL